MMDFLIALVLGALGFALLYPDIRADIRGK